MKKIINKLKLVFIVLIIFVLSFCLKIYAENIDYLDDGIYKTTFSITDTSSMGKTMISKYFDEDVLIEKSNGMYYLSLTLNDSSQINNLIARIDKKLIGYEETIDNNKIIYTYTLNEVSIKNKININAYVYQMEREVEFSIIANINDLSYVSGITNLSERPAEFIPEFRLESIGDIEVPLNTTYEIDAVSAYILDEECDVSISAYYNDELISLDNNVIELSNLGKYKILYKATSDKYKTSFNNNTFSYLSFNINVVLGELSILKINNESNIIAKYVEQGSLYDEIYEIMKNKSNHYEIISAYKYDGNKIYELDETKEIFIRCNDSYNKNNIKIYQYDNNLNELNYENYGRYLKINSNKLGIFIISVPGVPFVMPMWGYILIIIIALILLIGLIVLTIILMIRHKKKKNNDKLEEEKILNEIDIETNIESISEIRGEEYNENI